MVKSLKNMIMMMSIVFILWFSFSYIEIICKNTNINPQYSSANIIINTFNK